MRVKWWGWGLQEERYPQEALEKLLNYLRSRGLRIGEYMGPPPRPKLHTSRLTSRDLDILRRVSEVKLDDDERLARSLGKGYLDLVDAYEGRVEATDAVILPRSVEEVKKVLKAARERGLAVVPFGGGTSVLGGVRPLKGRHRAVLTLDLRRLNNVLEVDEESLLVWVQAGISGPDLEAALQARGLTLGHFPQSFHFSTLGGWIATRSTGHLSGAYGRIEEMVQALRVVTPMGEIVTRQVPARAAGPELRELLVGSEGALGVIVEASLRVRAIPEAREEGGFLFPGFEEALQAARHLVQAGIPPALLRVSDEEETRALMAVAGLEVEDQNSLAILGFEGSRSSSEDLMGQAERLWEDLGGVNLGPQPAAAWKEEYYRTPYLRDELVARSILVETLETAAPWSRLLDLHSAVSNTASQVYADQGVPGLVLCHLSHAYRDGGSLYFTLLASQLEGRCREQWQQLKQRVTEVILRAGATLSHHHGIGADHVRWMEVEHGQLGVTALGALKRALDPDGNMNPGKLLEER